MVNHSCFVRRIGKDLKEGTPHVSIRFSSELCPFVPSVDFEEEKNHPKKFISRFLSSVSSDYCYCVSSEGLEKKNIPKISIPKISVRKKVKHTEGKKYFRVAKPRNPSISSGISSIFEKIKQNMAFLREESENSLSEGLSMPMPQFIIGQFDLSMARFFEDKDFLSEDPSMARFEDPLYEDIFRIRNLFSEETNNYSLFIQSIKSHRAIYLFYKETVSSYPFILPDEDFPEKLSLNLEKAIAERIYQKILFTALNRAKSLSRFLQRWPEMKSFFPKNFDQKFGENLKREGKYYYLKLIVHYDIEIIKSDMEHKNIQYFESLNFFHSSDPQRDKDDLKWIPQRDKDDLKLILKQIINVHVEEEAEDFRKFKFIRDLRVRFAMSLILISNIEEFKNYVPFYFTIDQFKAEMEHMSESTCMTAIRAFIR